MFHCHTLSVSIPLPVAIVTLISLASAQACTHEELGAASQDHLGWSIAAIGDIDNDGVGDLALGAPEVANPDTGGGATGPGFVRICSGRTGLPLGIVTGNQFGEMFGASVVSLADHDGDGRPDGNGDVDGDGVPDFLVAAPRFSGTSPRQGRVDVISGATRTVIGSIANPAPTTGGRFGFAVTVVGNVSGDGRPEFVVAAPFWSAAGGGTGGRVYLFGWGTGTTTTLLGTRQGQPSSSGTQLGYEVCGIGDASGDGVADVLVQENGTQTVLLLSLAAFTGSPIATMQPPFGYTGITFGWTLAGLGDLDGDGRREFAIGVPDCAAGNCGGAGFVQVFSGSATGTTLRNTLRPTTRLLNANIRFGAAVAGAGDVDGDLVPDVAVGAPEADPVGTTSGTDDAGEVHVFAGSSLLTGTPARRLVVFDGRSGEQTGHAIAGVGDTDQDGAPDLAVTSPLAGASTPVALTNCGRATLVRHVRASRLYALGCAPTGQVPPDQHVAMAGGPCRGDQYALHLTQLPPNSLCVLGLGVAPANLPGFLQPQCTLLVQPLASAGIAPGNQAFATFALPIPANPSLAGLSLFWQWVVIGANYPASVEFSAGLQTTVR